MSSPRAHLRRLLAASAILTVALVGTPAQAAGDPHKDLAGRYGSLTASLTQMYAAEKGVDMQTYLAGQQMLLVPPSTAALEMPELAMPATPTPAQQGTGSTVEGLSEAPDATIDPSSGPTSATPDVGLGEVTTLDVASLSANGGLLLNAAEASSMTGGVSLSATDLSSLNSQLAAADMSLNSTAFKDIKSLAKAVTKSARTPDGAVTLAGAQWAKDLASLRTPKLTAPGTPGAKMPGVPADALPFGLLMNKSLTTMVTDFPDLISAAKKNGTAQPNLMPAWNKSMAKAYASSSGDLNSLLPNKCVGDMMSVMASGSAKSAPGVNSGACGTSCLAGGAYLHSAAQGMLNPQSKLSGKVTNPTAGVLGSSSLSGMSAWASSSVQGTTPQLTSAFAGLLGGGGCEAASSGAKATSSSKLPGIFGQLTR